MLLARFSHSVIHDTEGIKSWCHFFVQFQVVDCKDKETVKDDIRLAMLIEWRAGVAQGMKTLLGMRPRPWAAITKAVMWLLRHNA